jgi:hypothetical protein
MDGPPAKSKIAKTEHHHAIPYGELPTFMGELRAKQGVSAKALEFCILTATRTNETLGAKWSEIDLQAKVWDIPAQRMKSDRAHAVPLSNRALEIIAKLPRECEYLFSGRAAGKPLSNIAMLELLRDMRGKGATVHGFRSSLRDWAGNETNFPREIAEAALAHVVGDETERSYRRSDALAAMHIANEVSLSDRTQLLWQLHSTGTVSGPTMQRVAEQMNLSVDEAAEALNAVHTNHSFQVATLCGAKGVDAQAFAGWAKTNRSTEMFRAVQVQANERDFVRAWSGLVDEFKARGQR